MEIDGIEVQEINIPDIQDGLDKIYSDIFNSLGVEPGLLSKTKIGTALNEKYHNDGIDAMVYSERYLRDNLKNISDDVPILDEHKTYIIQPDPITSDTKIGANKNVVDEDYYSGDRIAHIHDDIFKILDMYMEANHITEGTLLDELKKFIELRYNYTIIKK